MVGVGLAAEGDSWEQLFTIFTRQGQFRQTATDRVLPGRQAQAPHDTVNHEL